MRWHDVMMFFRVVVILMVVGAFSASNNPIFAPVVNASRHRIGMVIMLAGSHKLAQYFEWGCRTIISSKDLVDMIVFHENNQQLKNVKCAENVKFINLGERGLSEMVAKHIMGKGSDEDVVKQLVLVVNNILTHTPRYLVEIKPMAGSMFKDYLSQYSHWTYTDPDIIWGNLTNWLNPNDLAHYDILSFSKHFDAGRLYLRGQFTIHRNVEEINSLWKKLSYFQHENYASRMGTAYRMLSEHSSSDEVFNINFQSAEGWYSQVVFKQQLKIKIVGMVFDDFFREAVVWMNGSLARCPVSKNLTYCIRNIQETIAENTGIWDLPNPKFESAIASREAMDCKMRWLPIETRYCLTEPVYDKTDALSQDNQQDVKLSRVGEAILTSESWMANDESVAPRQVKNWGAFFHFRHWSDAISLKTDVTWPTSTDGYINCMVLYLKSNYALAFEDCDEVAKNEIAGRVTLGNIIKTKDGKQTVKEVLSRARWELEVGYHVDHKKKSDRIEQLPNDGKKGKPTKKDPTHTKHRQHSKGGKRHNKHSKYNIQG